MLSPTLDLLKRIVQALLDTFIFIHDDLLERLVLLENPNILPELIYKACGAMLDEVVSGNEEVKGLISLLCVIVEHP